MNDFAADFLMVNPINYTVRSKRLQQEMVCSERRYPRSVLNPRSHEHQTPDSERQLFTFSNPGDDRRVLGSIRAPATIDPDMVLLK